MPGQELCSEKLPGLRGRCGPMQKARKSGTILLDHRAYGREKDTRRNPAGKMRVGAETRQTGQEFDPAARTSDVSQEGAPKLEGNLLSGHFAVAGVGRSTASRLAW